jgi:hypothetical protein
MADIQPEKQQEVQPSKRDSRVENEASSLPNATLSDGIKTIGGLLAVLTGIVVVAIIAGAAISKNSQTAATIAASTTGAVATIVGAYFGVKIGSDQTKQALDAGSAQAKQALVTANQQAKTKDKEAVKAQVYALHVPAEKANEVQAAAKAAQEGA